MWLRLLLLATLCNVAYCQNGQCALVQEGDSSSSIEDASSFVSSTSEVQTTGCTRDALCNVDKLLCVCKDGFEGNGVNCNPINTCKWPGKVMSGSWKRVGDNRTIEQMYPGDSVMYTCNDGYAIKRNNGQSIRTCLAIGSWDLKKAPACVVAKCDAPNGIIINGNSTAIPGNKYPRGGIVEYSCSPGYRIVGSSWQACISHDSLNGRWSNRAPTCEEIQCHDVGYPDDSNRIGSPPFFVGDEVRFRCMGGYTLIGSDLRTCQENGKWSGYVTICDKGAGDCNNPGTPINGRKQGRRYNQGDMVLFHCDNGFAMIGSRERTCLDTGEWSSNQPTCRGAGDYDDLETVAEAFGKKLDKVVDDTTSGHQAGRIIDLNYGGRLEIYIAIDGSSSITKPNFDRAVAFAKALVIKTGVSRRRRYGALVYTGEVVEHFDLPVHDTKQRVLDEFDRFQYPKVGGTSTSAALNYIHSRMIPLSNARFEAEDILAKQPPKRFLILLTDGASNTGGSPIDAANKLKKTYGVEIYVIGVRVTERNDELIGMASTELPDPHIFILQDFNALERLAGLLIGNTIDYSICGIAGDTKEKVQQGRISGGNNATDGAWPWQALIWLSPTGANGKQIPAAHSFCGASIISSTWILTAAHCFYDKKELGIENKESWHSNVLVGLGYTIQNPTIAEREKRLWTRQATVKRVITHPDYDNYDHDIALLELDKPIVFNNYIQPVCLPNKTRDSQLPLKSETGKMVVTGWGNTKQRNVLGDVIQNQDTKYLQQVFLEVIKWKICEDYVDLVQKRFNTKEKLTTNMFCVGGSSPSSCKGDSGGPVVKKMPPSNDRDEHWVQFGIVSFGYGCGAEGQHDIMTNVVEFVDWIQGITSIKPQ